MASDQSVTSYAADLRFDALAVTAHHTVSASTDGPSDGNSGSSPSVGDRPSSEASREGPHPTDRSALDIPSLQTHQLAMARVHTRLGTVDGSIAICVFSLHRQEHHGDVFHHLVGLADGVRGRQQFDVSVAVRQLLLNSALLTHAVDLHDPSVPGPKRAVEGDVCLEAFVHQPASMLMATSEPRTKKSDQGGDQGPRYRADTPGESNKNRRVHNRKCAAWPRSTAASCGRRRRWSGARVFVAPEVRR